MPDDLYIGVDLGTTGIKAGLFEATGRTVATSARGIELDTPAPGFAEFDADDYIAKVFAAIRELLRSPDVNADAVRAIGLSSQAQTFVVLDEAGDPIRPAVSWLDVRAGDEAEELSVLAEAGRGEPLTAIASTPKLLWLRRHEPEVMASAAAVQLLPDHLIYRLTGRAVSDPITAASTGAYDRWGRRWVIPVLETCGLTTAMMPDVASPGEPAGTLTAEAARQLGLAEDVAAIVGTNDQYAGALGAGNAFPGCASLALGTALAIVATTDSQEDIPPGLMISPHPASSERKALYAMLAFAKTSGVLLRWFQAQFTPSLSYEALFAEAASAPIGADGVTCIPHFSGTATPDFNPAVRGAFVGLTLSHTRAHLFRALLESLAFTVQENLERLGRAVPLTPIRAIGGGARSDVWLQMMADATGFAIERPRTREAACLGAAALAMVGAGRFDTVARAVKELFQLDVRFEPDAERNGRYDLARQRYHHWFRVTYPGDESA
ncbi:MAG: FGGY family carbohydrate kinase [Planctomycetota bacterium]